MQPTTLSSIVRRTAVMTALVAAGSVGAQGGPAKYPAMAPLPQYLMERNAEIALARSAAPSSISRDAGVLVLSRGGYDAAAESKNGFVCLVLRSWVGPDDPQFWNTKIRSPICLNAQAVHSYLPLVRMKTQLILTGKSKDEMFRTVMAARDARTLPALEAGATAYMMSRQQYLNDDGKAWHPHVMFYVAKGDAGRWGANLPGSPLIAADEPEEGITVLMVPVSHWSDGTLVSH